MMKPINQFSSELNFLLTCLNDQIPETIGTLDWCSFLHLVYRHKVSHIVYKILKKYNDVVPSDFLSELKLHCVNNTYRTLKLTSELIRIIQYLSAANIPNIVLKGPPLAKKLYGDPTQRESLDIDILIPIERLTQAHELFLANGYACTWFPKTTKQYHYYLNHRKDFTYYHADLNISVELHWRWFNNPNFFALPIDDIWDTCQTVTINNVEIKTLPLENEFLYLLAHASGHGWKYLFWLCDIKQLMSHHADFDWDRLIERAQKLGVIRPLIEGVYLSHQLFQTLLPAQIEKAASADQGTFFLIKIALFMIRRQDAPRLPMKQILNIRDFFLNQSLKYRLCFLKELFGMIPADWQLLQLNDKLFWVYHLIRPYSWIKRKIGGSGIQ